MESEQGKLKASSEKDYSNLQEITSRIEKINIKISENNEKLKDILSASWEVEKGTGGIETSSIATQTGESPLPQEPPIIADEQHKIEELEKENAPEIEIENPGPEVYPENSDAEELQLGGKRRKKKNGRRRPRLPRMYGGTKVPMWRKNKSATSIFRSYKRLELNRMAVRWGVTSPMKYKKRKDLAIAMKLLMHYRYGDLKLKKDIDRVAKIVGIHVSHYKTKSGIKRVINKKTTGMKMRGGSFFVAELKKGLQNSLKTPLLTGGQGRFLMKGGQGKFLTMRKSSYLTGGKASRKHRKGGSTALQLKRRALESKLDKAKRKEKEALKKKISVLNKRIQKQRAGKRTQKGGDKIQDMQKKRSEYEKQLLTARGKEVQDLRKRIDGLNGLLKRMMRGGCGSCGVIRGGNASLGGKRKRGRPRKSKKKSSKKKRSRKKRSRKKRSRKK